MKHSVMKKMVGMVVIAGMVFSMVACGNTTQTTNDVATTSAASTETVSTTEEATSEGASSSTTGDSYNIGMTVADLTNPIWAEVCKEIQTKGSETYGCSVNVVACKNDPSTQKSQVEDFIQQDVDAIIISAVDKNSLDDVIKEAQAAGILVMCYGVHTNIYDVSLTNDNAGAGKIIGEDAAAFINENYDGKAQVGLITYKENQECLERGEAMKAALAEKCPDAEIVDEVSSVVSDESMTYVENWLQAYQDMKVIMSIGDGGGIGANQAVKAAGKADGFGIFAVDGTIEALQLMANGDPIKEEIAFGAGWQLGDQVIDVCYDALKNGVTEKDQVTPNEVVTLDNIKDMITEWGYEDQIDLTKLN